MLQSLHDSEGEHYWHVKLVGKEFSVNYYDITHITQSESHFILYAKDRVDYLQLADWHMTVRVQSIPKKIKE
jgi:hypothetical protein